MTTLAAAMVVVDLINKGVNFFDSAHALANKIHAARAEERDLTPEEVQPYLDKLDASIAKFEALRS